MLRLPAPCLVVLARKAAVLRAHCVESGRAVELSHLSTALVGASTQRPRGSDPARYAASVHAGTVEDHSGGSASYSDGALADRLMSLRSAVQVSV